MLASHYFPVLVSLTASLPGSLRNSAACLDAMAQGDLAAANQQIDRWVENTSGAREAECCPEVWQLNADLNLILGFDADAEDSYRQAIKVSRGSKEAIRLSSARSAAWQAMFRNRFGTALACFTRLVEESGLSPQAHLEAQFGIVCVLQELGYGKEALKALERLEASVQEHRSVLKPGWDDFLDTLRFDLAVQVELRSFATFRDHAFWQSGRLSNLSSNSVDASSASVVVTGDSLRPAHSAMLRARVSHLMVLRKLAHGDRAGFAQLNAHLNWARERGLQPYQRYLRLEVSLAALAGHAPDIAEAFFAPIQQLARLHSADHRQLEYLYCAAKLKQFQGHEHEWQAIYGCYAVAAMVSLRENSHLCAAYLSLFSCAASQLDDIGARLPAKYRRAYAYVLDNLCRTDLSVREVAAAIGVTERALQLAFKNSLGISPTELIRRQRMERIHADLTGMPNIPLGDVLSTAKKWGVQNRSTLVSSYKKQYNETPAETLTR